MEWRTSGLLPGDLVFDVVYLNETFEPPVVGCIPRARLLDGFWRGENGTQIPEAFAVSWRASRSPHGALPVVATVRDATAPQSQTQPGVRQKPWRSLAHVVAASLRTASARTHRWSIQR